MICFVLAIDSQRFRKLFFFFQYMKQQKQQKDYIKTRKEDRTKEQIFASHGFTQLMYLREMELRLSLEKPTMQSHRSKGTQYYPDPEHFSHIEGRTVVTPEAHSF